MKKPVCTNRSILDFQISEKDCRRYKICKVMSEIPLSQWSNVSDLVDFMCPANSKRFASSKTCYDRYIGSFNSVSHNLVRHPNVQTYAANVLHYLKHPSVKEKFENYHQDKIDTARQDMFEKQQEDNQNDLNAQTRIISQLEVGLENDKRIDTLQAQINFASTDEHITSSTNQAESSQQEESHQQEESRQREESSQQAVPYRSIKEIIFNYAVNIHNVYQSKQTLSDKKLHAMATGLSCILDLGGNAQCLLFSEKIWSKLLSKYTTRHNMPPVPMNQPDKDKWNYIVQLFSKQNSLREARAYIWHLKLNDITESQVKTFDFFEELLTLRQSRAFILDAKNASKVSEADYVYQLWLPILSSLFNINENIVRIKTGETVLEGSTEAKAVLYDGLSHAIGFKVDVRILVDIGDEEFDLACGEGCLQSAKDDKVESDNSKLLREGKEIEKTFRELLDDSKENIQSQAWCIQFIGRACHFSTVNATKYGYYINVPQFSLSYPYSFFDIKGTNALDSLFSFKNNIEKSALALKRIAKNNQERISLAKHNHTELSLSPTRPSTSIDPTWYTPPHSDRTKSRVPQYAIHESDIESTEADDNEVDANGESDLYGFTQTKNGWYSQVTGKTFATHPYHM